MNERYETTWHADGVVDVWLLAVVDSVDVRVVCVIAGMYKINSTSAVFNRAWITALWSRCRRDGQLDCSERGRFSARYFAARAQIPRSQWDNVTRQDFRVRA